MGAIYSAADFVLALVSGASMNDRIPGVKAHRVPVVYERTVKVDGLVLETNLPNLEQAMQMSKWASRGWTYQENYLAIRKLYMTSLQLIYQCNLGEVYEDLSLTYLSDDRMRGCGLSCCLLSCLWIASHDRLTSMKGRQRGGVGDGRKLENGRGLQDGKEPGREQ